MSRKCICGHTKYAHEPMLDDVGDVMDYADCTIEDCKCEQWKE